ncbi:hypothetical protein KAX97_05300 [candidate division WOR-3 bacterium]|nr:hypothetical protein [candidate division WOR-3 bacterium]
MKTKIKIILIIFLIGLISNVSAIDIELVLFDPDPIKTDYAGKFNITYGITHDSLGLNNSSIAYLFAVNYTIDNCYNHSIRVPSNSIATTTPSITEYGNIFRGFRRNVTPYLNQEFNTTITEGNVWKWGMYDYAVYPHVLVNPINSTYTFVNMTSYRVMVLEQMHYLAAFDMFCTPKTDYEISVDQSLITKMWDVEQINGRDDNYLIYGHFPTGVKSITPTSDLDIYMCNDTFNPLTSDYTTCQCCTLVGSWDEARCTNYTLAPHPINARFVDPLVVNVSTLQIDITPTNYIIFSSNTPAHKPYTIKMTNADPGITNLTWADTKVSWEFDEIGKTATPYSYTPGIFYNFIRDYEQLEIQLYAADNTDTWGYSGVNSYPIGVFAPQNPNSGSINYFNMSGIKDYDMNGYYLNNWSIGVLCGNDPDGGSVTHTLNLYGNGDFETCINATFTCGGHPSTEVLFNSTPYTSNDIEYYIELVTTDSDTNSVSSHSPIFYISPVPTNTMYIYYPNLNSTTEITYADGSGYHKIVGDNLTMHGLKVVSLQNKLIVDDIITNPTLILKEKNIYLLFYLLVFAILIVGAVSLIARMWKR